MKGRRFGLCTVNSRVYGEVHKYVGNEINDR